MTPKGIGLFFFLLDFVYFLMKTSSLNTLVTVVPMAAGRSRLAITGFADPTAHLCPISKLSKLSVVRYKERL